MKSNMKDIKDEKQLRGLQGDLLKMLDNETEELETEISSYPNHFEGKEMKNPENKFHNKNQTFNWVNLGKEFENSQKVKKALIMKLYIFKLNLFDFF